MADNINNYNVLRAGGFRHVEEETALSHYSLRWLGPDDRDAVVFNAPYDPAVVPDQGHRHNLPKGRIFTLTPAATFKPGVWAEDELPVAALSVGSDSDDLDVTGAPYYGDPQLTSHAVVPFKNEANAPFWAVAPGYIFYVSEFEQGKSYEIGTPLTAVASLTAFNTAGQLTPGTVYKDHIVGVVTATPHYMHGYNPELQGLQFEGLLIPRLSETTLTALITDSAAAIKSALGITA